jgi:hypothetical protein
MDLREVYPPMIARLPKRKVGEDIYLFVKSAPIIEAHFFINIRIRKRGMK